jgi:IS30 family transposase
MEIFRYLYIGKIKPNKIAERLNRRPSSISREICSGSENGFYDPFMAEVKHLEAVKEQRPHLKMTYEAWELIKPKLELRWSPEQIAKWLLNEYPLHAMSGKTIYNYVLFHMKGELKKLALEDLRQRGKKRKRGKDGEKRGKLSEMTLIDSRPIEINARIVPGNWEGDLIMGKKHKSALSVLVERKTRYVQLDLLEKFDAMTVRKTIERRFRRIQPTLVKSLTVDQGKENCQHRELSKNMGIDIYFCHPHSPWEKGTCENTNYLIRDMLYPVEDFRELTQYEVSRIARLLNERPRKTLGFKTPKQVFEELR